MFYVTDRTLESNEYHFSFFCPQFYGADKADGKYIANGTVSFLDGQHTGQILLTVYHFISNL